MIDNLCPCRNQRLNKFRKNYRIRQNEYPRPQAVRLAAPQSGAASAAEADPKYEHKRLRIPLSGILNLSA